MIVEGRSNLVWEASLSRRHGLRAPGATLAPVVPRDLKSNPRSGAESAEAGSRIFFADLLALASDRKVHPDLYARRLASIYLVDIFLAAEDRRDGSSEGEADAYVEGERQGVHERGGNRVREERLAFEVTDHALRKLLHD